VGKGEPSKKTGESWQKKKNQIKRARSWKGFLEGKDGSPIANREIQRSPGKHPLDLLIGQTADNLREDKRHVSPEGLGWKPNCNGPASPRG
jgi:hypothetical protein